ncbi:MAG: hypothetical protein WC683_00275 [bacterium]
MNKSLPNINEGFLINGIPPTSGNLWQTKIQSAFHDGNEWYYLAAECAKESVICLKKCATIFNPNNVGESMVLSSGRKTYKFPAQPTISWKAIKPKQFERNSMYIWGGGNMRLLRSNNYMAIFQTIGELPTYA